MIEVNEYVRTKDGYIAKCIEIETEQSVCGFDNTIRKDYGDKLDFLYLKNIAKCVVKHSKQLIDLIEIGDYVNGHLVEEVRISCFDSSIFVHEYAIELHENDIKTILTKEQFEANCYKVGGENE